MQPPSDAAVIAGFERNAPQFATVVRMMEQDPRVGTIGEDFVSATGTLTTVFFAELGITKDRLAEYRRILASIGVKRLDRLQGGGVQFGTWASGFAGNTHHKGVVWLPRGPPSGGRRRYAPIREHWYVFQD